MGRRLGAAQPSWPGGCTGTGPAAPASEPGSTGQPVEDLRLNGEADGQARPLDVLGGAAAAVDLEQVAGVALEVDAEVGPVLWL
jgi:hypothetical protein